jgi:ATPase subunit of ABC transporter with duplicated ATPase domains
MEAVIWLERALPLLTNYTTLVITSHDQIFLDRIVETTIHLRHRQLDYFDGPPGLMMRTEAEERDAASNKASALAKKKDHILSSIASGKKAARDKGDDNKARMVKSREKKLEDRFGLETSAKGGRFKLNRDLGGYHTSKRAEIVIREDEPEVRIKVHDPPQLRSAGPLVHLEKVGVGYKGKTVLEGVDMTIQQGARIALLGAVRVTFPQGEA